MIDDNDNGTPEAPPAEEEPQAAAPQDDNIVGELSLSAMRQIQAFQNQQNQLLMEIGNLEHRKASVLAHLSQVQGQAQALLASEAKRLEIPEGQQWSVGPDGKARVHQQGPPPGSPAGG